MGKMRKGPSPSRGHQASEMLNDTAGTTLNTGHADGSSNAFIQEQLGLGQDASTSNNSSSDTNKLDSQGQQTRTATVILSADQGGNPFEAEFWQHLNFGHCWVDILTPDGQKDSWGYTPSNISTFPRTQPWKSVPGEVLNPDGSFGPTGTLVRQIDEEQLDKAESWAKGVGNTYNLFGLGGGQNCAKFAKGFFEQATGERAPTSMFGALIASPSDMSDAMNRQAEREMQNNPNTTAVADLNSDTESKL